MNSASIHNPSPPNTTTISKDLKVTYGSPVTNLIREIINKENQQTHPKDVEVTSTLQDKEENHIPSKDTSSCPTVSTSTRPTRREVKGGEYGIGEYYRLCLNNYILDLADMKMGILPKDDGLFWQAVNMYKALHGTNNDDQVIKTINTKITDAILQNRK